TAPPSTPLAASTRAPILRHPDTTHLLLPPAPRRHHRPAHKLACLPAASRSAPARLHAPSLLPSNKSCPPLGHTGSTLHERSPARRSSLPDLPAVLLQPGSLLPHWLVIHCCAPTPPAPKAPC